ncbi:bifunctional acetate--CoA ligase family protein/GNAT family N-acetyltransferase [Oceanimonas baumannii]|uniref:Acetyltransferase n=1 Tax=Oceanimonas baumannii TaxID=129578 RepID=A0A235CIP5_9GAMM|nr:bifunctional acetate--CoA ligase family protein/GNAT family N-acetyltransferase [Oceanimonas baumannii]OYD23715.1 protein acetyltransferase [Oceanimonas baumannii]TDW55896.1 acetyltransferase [Oceanimonas baumannii]
MPQQGLDALFRPASIAVIGASHRDNGAGKLVMKNLLAGNFSGPVMPVNPKYEAVAGVMAYPDINSLPRIPDLAIICTPANKNAHIIEQLGQKGCKAAIILAAGTSNSQLEQMKASARKHRMRLLGPNSMGVILPHLGLNVSFAPFPAKPGRIAFVSQSSAVCATILDWARHNDIGFSHFISLGDACDINFAQLLDYLSRDRHTSAILLYMDAVQDARAFMSAARAASRNKAVLVVKSGKTRIGAQLGHIHTGGHVGMDAAYDAAIRRAGMLRVRDTHDLFAAVETLNHSHTLRGERLVILTNGGGPAINAIDTLLARGGKLASLTETTSSALDRVLPPAWSRTNPIDIVGDAPVERYVASLRALLDSDDFDAILIMHAPSAAVNSTRVAKELIEVLRTHPRAKRFNILTNWSGETSAFEARRCFTEAGIPTYRTPESAAGAFMHMVEYRRNQKQLMETPESISDMPSDGETVRELIGQAFEEGLHRLDTHEVSRLMAAYGIQVLPTWIATDGTEAAHIAEQIGYPVAIKLRSPDIVHKSEVSGVVLNLRSAAEVAQAADALVDRVKQAYPSARVHGLMVQRMARRAGSQELHIAVRSDPVFGPVILLGDGGVDLEGEEQAAVALPPLNMTLARYLVIHALKSGKVRANRSQHPMDMMAVCQVLTQVSHLIINHPEIVSLDIHPLLATGSELIALDVSLKLAPFEGDGQTRLAIRPYPREWEERALLKDGTPVTLRPILPEDEPAHKDFVSHVTDEDRYKRFFADVVIGHEELAHMTQIDYDREMAFVAVADKGNILGVVRAVSDPDNDDAEFAVLVRSDLKGVGLGRMLMEKIIRYGQQRGLNSLSGITMPSNRGMITLARKLGFKTKTQLEDGIVELKLLLEHEPQ